jgi:hypothetical protein
MVGGCEGPQAFEDKPLGPPRKRIGIFKCLKVGSSGKQPSSQAAKQPSGQAAKQPKQIKPNYNNRYLRKVAKIMSTRIPSRFIAPEENQVNIGRNERNYGEQQHT